MEVKIKEKTIRYGVTINMSQSEVNLLLTFIGRLSLPLIEDWMGVLYKDEAAKIHGVLSSLYYSLK